MSSSSRTPSGHQAGGKRREYWFLFLVLGSILAWLVFATLIFPKMIEIAYSGEGFAWLSRRMAGRGNTPLEEYLADGHRVSLRVLGLSAPILALALLNLVRGSTLHAHWFKPAPLRDLAIARIVIVGMQLALLLYPGGAGACVGCSLEQQLWLSQADASLFQPIPALAVLLGPLGWGVRPEPMFLAAVWLFAVLSGVAALIGFFGRPATLGLALASTLLVAHSYSYGEHHHPEGLITVALWALAFSPSNRALSLDAIALRVRAAAEARHFEAGRIPQQDEYARWPLRLMQWMLAFTYLDAGLSKLLNGGLAWFEGSTFAFYLAHDGIRGDLPLGLWLSQHTSLLPPLAVGSAVFELGFPLAVLVPVLAPAFVAGGVGLHTGIYAAMGAPFFQHMALYVVFLEPLRDTYRRFVPEPAKRQKMKLIFDGHCLLCIRSVAVLEVLDPGNRLEFVDLESDWAAVGASLPVTQEDARHAMHVVLPGDQVASGFFAFRSLARTLPLLWPLLPVLHAPGAARVGPWIYAHVAGRRRRVRCASGACGIGPELEEGAGR